MLNTKIDLEEVLKPLKKDLWINIINGIIIYFFIVIIFGLATVHVKRWDLEQKQHFELEKKALLKNYEYIMEFANDAIILTNDQERIVQANKKCVELYGYSEDELKNMRISVLYLNENSEEIANEESGNLRVLEMEHVSRNGQKIPVEVSKHQVKIENEFFYQRIIKDISDRKKAEADMHKMAIELMQTNLNLEQIIAARTSQLEEAYKDLESFSYSVSHDLKAPLRTITGFTDALRDCLPQEISPKAEDFIRRIQAASTSMSGLIDNLLELSRIGRKVFDPKILDIEPHVQKTVTEIQSHYPDWHGLIKYHLECCVLADEFLLKTALNNAISNAFKFSSKKDNPKLDISCCMKEGACLVSVSDNGTGFDSKYAAKLFTPFQRLHSQREFPGTGIGLSIIHKIMVRHGGRAWIESVPEHVTTLYLEFPQKNPNE